MALPQLNDQPKYDLVIPSTKQKVRFRPFLVKEEKVMMMAMETEDQSQILNTIVDTIGACIIDSVDTSKFTTFDVEYCFLQIRSKSVGEKVQLNFDCTECSKANETSIKVDDINIDVPKMENIIKINDDISVEMRWPTFNQVLQEKDIFDTESSVDQIFGLIRTCIVAIMTEEERYSTSDHTAEELNTFIESMSADQFAKIRDYVEAMPRLQHTIEFDCDGCGTHNSIQVEGMQNFFYLVYLTIA